MGAKEGQKSITISNNGITITNKICMGFARGQNYHYIQYITISIITISRGGSSQKNWGGGGGVQVFDGCSSD